MTTKVIIAGGGTGGHLMPALALAQAFRAARPDLEPVLVGAQRGVEASLLPSRPFRFYLLPLEPIYRGAWWKNLRWPLVAGRLLWECHDLLRREAPALVVGTGGYVAGPVLFAARTRRIPIALQEQNALPGITTRWLARWATQVHLGFPEAASRLRTGPRTRIFSLGNPITSPPDDPRFRERAREELRLPPTARVVLVTGGSQGSRAMNRAVADALAAGLLDDIALLWSTGRDHYGMYRPLDRPPMRQVRPFWDPISTAYGAADLVVARAGAMTTAELCAYGLPSILVPFPHAAADHQNRNAETLERAGAAVRLPEPGLTGQALARTVGDVLGRSTRLMDMSRAAAKRGRPHAATEIVAELLPVVAGEQKRSA